MNCLMGTARFWRLSSARVVAFAPSTRSSKSSGGDSDPGNESDPETFLWIKKHNYRDNLNALDSVRFRRPAAEDFQHLDVGCGPGNFTTEALLPRLRPCRRLVATDKSAAMVAYAREHFGGDQDVVYDVLDIECGDNDAERIVDKYGPFDRVYSFMAFHYVRNLEQAYRNVFLCLKDGGEFLTLSFTGSAITDVWYRLFNTEEWKAFLPDPKHVFSERFCYGTPIPEERIASEEQLAIGAAGMELVSCRMHDIFWTMPDLDSWLDCYVPFFRLDAQVPEEKRGAFLDVCRSVLREATSATPEGVRLRLSVIVVHTQKPCRR
ncbi:juvenile hormone acid O-methyltransferase-like [Dermacentor albipictus]|uniref:juvenile hormone acid O-methyltransferase-like n=1 Tax=Dermacentor albipictus TaxID=60249 RepID=UPI0031FC89C2